MTCCPIWPLNRDIFSTAISDFRLEKLQVLPVLLSVLCQTQFPLPSHTVGSGHVNHPAQLRPLSGTKKHVNSGMPYRMALSKPTAVQLFCNFLKGGRWLLKTQHLKCNSSVCFESFSSSPPHNRSQRKSDTSRRLGVGAFIG